MRAITFFILMLMAVLAQAQFRELEVGLKNGQTLYPTTLRLKDPLFKKQFLLVDDSLEFRMSEVDYYQTPQNYFLVRNLDFYSDQPLKRIVAGKVSVFSYMTTSYTPPMPAGPNGAMMGGGMSSRTLYYYQKDSRLKSLMLETLKYDLEDDPLSMEKLNQITRLKWLRIGLWTVGGVMALVGLNEMVQEANEKGPPYDNVSLKPNAPFIIGSLMVVAPLAFMPNKNKRMIEAIRIYNR